MSAARLAAEELAATTRGVLSVQNQLVADDEVAVSVERALCSSGIKLEDLEALAGLRQVNLGGVIVGKALYEGRFTVAEARRVLEA